MYQSTTASSANDTACAAHQACEAAAGRDWTPQQRWRCDPMAAVNVFPLFGFSFPLLIDMRLKGWLCLCVTLYHSIASRFTVLEQGMMYRRK